MMHILALTGLVLPASPLAVPPTVAAQEEEIAVILEVAAVQAQDDLFAPATEDLALAWPEAAAGSEGPEGISVLDVVHAYGLATDQRLAIRQDTRRMLAETPAPLDRATSVPAREVQGFVEAMLRSSECVMTVDRSSAPRVVGIHSLMTQDRNRIRARAMNIDCERLDVLRAHPAVLFSTVVDLPNVDVRQLSNSIRTMITDANTLQILPAGNTNSMVLVGYGSNLADLIEQLRSIDAASAKAQVTVSHQLVRLENAAAEEIAQIVERALITSRELRTPRTYQQGPQQQRPIQVSVLADARLNGLLVTCRSEDLAEAREIIAQLDVK